MSGTTTQQVKAHDVRVGDEMRPSGEGRFRHVNRIEEGTQEVFVFYLKDGFVLELEGCHNVEVCKRA